MKSQPILFWFPGSEAYSSEWKEMFISKIANVLEEYFEKPVTVVMLPQKIQFLSEESIRDLIDTLENIIK